MRYTIEYLTKINESIEESIELMKTMYGTDQAEETYEQEIKHLSNLMQETGEALEKNPDIRKKKLENILNG